MPETTGKILLTYDVNDNWDAVKATLISEYRYTDIGVSTTKVYTLPNTTLLHHSKQVSAALSDLEAACLKHRVTLEKASAVLVADAAYFNN